MASLEKCDSLAVFTSILASFLFRVQWGALPFEWACTLLFAIAFPVVSQESQASVALIILYQTCFSNFFMTPRLETRTLIHSPSLCLCFSFYLSSIIYLFIYLSIYLSSIHISLFFSLSLSHYTRWIIGDTHL